MINEGIASCAIQMRNVLTIVDNVCYFQGKNAFYAFKQRLEQYFNVEILDAFFPYSDVYKIEDIYSAIYNSYVINS